MCLMIYAWQWAIFSDKFLSETDWELWKRGGRVISIHIIESGCGSIDLCWDWSRSEQADVRHMQLHSLRHWYHQTQSLFKLGKRKMIASSKCKKKSHFNSSYVLKMQLNKLWNLCRQMNSVEMFGNLPSKCPKWFASQLQDGSCCCGVQIHG